MSHLLNIPDGFVRWGEACGNIYIQSLTKESYFEAFKKCCELNMRLLSIDFQEEDDCITYITNTWPGNDTWTSASNLYCKRQWRWCGSPNATSRSRDTIWTNYAFHDSNDNDVESCAYYDIMSEAYSDDICDLPKIFTCEAPKKPDACAKFSCPRVVQNTLHVSELLGNVISKNFTLLNESCGFIYYESKLKLMYEQAAKECAKIGAKLLNIEDTKKRDCAYKSKKPLKKVGYWDSTVWTSGREVGCPHTWLWCSTNKPLSKDTPWLPGKPQDPYNINHCAVASWNEELKLSSESCAKKLNFVCESPVFTEVASCRTPECHEVTCPKTNELNKDFLLIGVDGSTTFFLIKSKVNQLIAMKTCCDFGMKLLSVENLDTLKTIASLNEKLTINQTTWTSGSNRKCAKYWTWCEAENSMTWMADDVTYSSKMFHCACVTWGEVPKLSSLHCANERFFICESKVKDISKVALKVAKAAAKTTPPPAKPATTLRSVANKPAVGKPAAAQTTNKVNAKLPLTTARVTFKQMVTTRVMATTKKSMLPVTPARPIVTPNRVTPGKPVVTPGKVNTPGKPIVTPSKPLVNLAKPVVTPGKPMVTPGKPIMTPGKAAVTPGKAVVTAKPPSKANEEEEDDDDEE